MVVRSRRYNREQEMKIIFNNEDKTASKHWPPILAKDYIPEWYSKLPSPKESYAFNEEVVKTISACVPVSDLLTSGYIIRTNYEIRVAEKIINFTPKMNIVTAKPIGEVVTNKMKNVKSEEVQGLHPSHPVGIYSDKLCPMRSQQKTNTSSYFKFDTEWSVKTPPGYSCLVMQPYYLFRNDVSIMPAIIDTDKFDKKIPVVGFLTGIAEEARFFCGDPLIQIIPFKRDEWQAEFTSDKPMDKTKMFLYNAYKKIFHTPKIFR